MKPIRIDVARINRNKKKLCTCIDPHYEIDVKNRMVECLDCGAIVEAFDALEEIAKYWDKINQTHEDMLKERESVVGYEPRLKVIKELSQRYPGKNSQTVPCCPNCKEPFELHELIEVPWCTRFMYERWKQEKLFKED